ncbi:MAG: RICIN domain-containing protein [Butyrivibrio sp.]|nr:RICIN domain-containing protein [Butyrivibrio sp.]
MKSVYCQWKRLICTISGLICCIVFSLFIFSFDVLAFSPRTSAPTDYSTYYGSKNTYNPYDSFGKKGNCTWYAWGRAYEILKQRPSGLGTGNANVWYSKSTYPKGSSPKLGAIMCWNYGTYGHVAVVEAIGNDGTITYSESSYDPAYLFKVRTRKPSEFKNGFQGYVYLPIVEEDPIGTGLSQGNGQVIPDGDYQIVSAIDSNLGVDVPGMTYDLSEYVTNAVYPNAKVFHNINTETDVFTLKYDSATKCYVIFHKGSKQNMCLDVESCKMTRGANVGYWVYQTGNNQLGQQLWSLKAVDNTGYFTIQSKLNGYYLDIYGSSNVDGTNLYLYSQNNANNQKWAFVPYTPSTSTGSIKEGDYKIASGANASKIIGIDTSKDYPNAVLENDKNDNSQIFTVKKTSDGSLYLIHKATGYLLDIEQGGTSSNVGVWPNVDETPTNGRFQEWVITSAGSGTYKILSRWKGAYLSVSGNNIQVSKWANSSAENFKLIPVINTNPSNPDNPAEDDPKNPAGENADSKVTEEQTSVNATDSKAERIDSSLKNAKSIKLASGKKSITVSWKKLTKKQQKQIAGIEIQYSTDKAFKENVKTVNVGKNKASKKIGKLTPKKKYFVRVRVYKKDGSEKVYSNWSSPKSKKVK